MEMLTRLQTYASFVRISHTVFALPFAVVGALLAARSGTAAAWSWTRFAWIIACMFTARSAAMGFNRLADAAHDARNPRTAMRELPAGRMARGEAIAFIVINALLFLGCAWMVSPLCFALAPVALAIVFWYSLAKRFTHYAQMFLGLAMAVAPVGGWIAMGGPLSPVPFLLGIAIGTWVGGFDVLYACQDYDVDRREGMRSIPVKFGIAGSIRISRLMHVITVLALAGVGVVAELGQIYMAGVAGVTGLLIYEQSLVSEDDLSQVKRAFDLNGWVGMLYLATTLVAVVAR
ncbi:MAG: putative 4-hydroxybenzoate polyprenyltransferase [Acidobacteria bacterium]|nr:putative 4-hydroxybenzoate polyprenyltransferase [Acidobacteriota bacterium]